MPMIYIEHFGFKPFCNSNVLEHLNFLRLFDLFDWIKKHKLLRIY